MQWMQDPSQSSVDNLNNVRYEADRYFRNMKEYLRAKIEEIETNSKIKIFGTFVGKSMTLRRVTSLELIYRFIANDCRGFKNLSYIILLR